MESHLVAALIEAVPLPLLLIDTDERIAAANAPARALFGAQVVGRHHALALRQPGPLAAIEAGLRRGEAGLSQHVVSGPSGEAVYRLHVRPVAGEGLGGVLCSFEDTTEAGQISQFRRDFVANVSHELRTPLTSLLGFIETLQGAAKDDPKGRARFLALMAAEAERMNRLVRDLLQLSRVEAEERVRPAVRVDLAAVLTGVIETLRPLAGRAGTTIVLNGEAGAGWVQGDADQLAQVFYNLVENAVKYGAPGGQVTLTLRRVPHDSALRAPALAVDVTDQGEGIAAEHVPRLTERFYRVDPHRSRAAGGTGLGLAIVKHIVQRHRGRLAIVSAPGVGSTFTVLLPVEQSAILAAS